MPLYQFVGDYRTFAKPLPIDLGPWSAPLVRDGRQHPCFVFPVGLDYARYDSLLVVVKVATAVDQFRINRIRSERLVPVIDTWNHWAIPPRFNGFGQQAARMNPEHPAVAQVCQLDNVHRGGLLTAAQPQYLLCYLPRLDWLIPLRFGLRDLVHWCSSSLSITTSRAWQRACGFQFPVERNSGAGPAVGDFERGQSLFRLIG